MLSLRPVAFLSLICCLAPIFGTGCSSHTAEAQRPPALPPTEAQLAAEHVNEAGFVPILEYHAIDSGSGPLSRSPALFRHDLERLYEEGYRAVSLSEYLENRMDLPRGASPVVITFDDARPSQFRYLPDGTLDPECAVAILTEFHQIHPDFPLKATFFVLLDPAFGQLKEGALRVRQLHALGFEIENHTRRHRYFNTLNDYQIAREIAEGKAAIQAAAPDVNPNILALPGGGLPRSGNRTVLRQGEYRRTQYSNEGVILAAGNPAPSPVTRDFDSLAVPRINTVSGNGGIDDWLDYLLSHPDERYVSDGDPGIVTAPRFEADRIDPRRVRGLRVRLYGPPQRISRHPTRLRRVRWSR